MIRNFLLLLTILLSLIAKSQDTTVVYYDAAWKKTSSENAIYSRKTYQEEKKKWIATDYNKDGSARVRGEYSKRNLKIKNGTFNYYYENGNKKELSEFNENIQRGNFKEWYENGQIESLGFYENNEQSGEWISFYKDGQVNYKGRYCNGKTVGVWSWFYENGQICSVEKYNEGEGVSGKYWTEQGEPVDSAIANYAPVFAGGLPALNRFLNENTKYPRAAKNKGVQGKVYVQFVIEKDGSISNVKIAMGVDPDLDEESLRVVRLMPYWTPGKLRNKLIKVSYIVPIKYSF